VSELPHDRDVQLQGRYAGFVTRIGGFVIDMIVLLGLFALGGQVLEFLVGALSGAEFTLRDYPVLSVIGLVLWALLYCAYPLGVSGRTLGMAIVGVRAVRDDGSHLGSGRAVVRVLATPLSFLLLGLGFLLVLLRRDRRALHDLIGGTAVVYGWDARAARLRFLARQPGS
jgi:uncharacterized RDD family membrane protein YckC